MSKPVFAVILDEADEAVLQRVKKVYGKDNVLIMNEGAALVCVDALANDIAVATGIKGQDDPIGGVVFKLNRSYAGFTHGHVWDWLRRAEGEDAT